MSVLILRLAAPLQSWAVTGKHSRRTSLPYPSKSGVVGLLAAACGIPRDAPCSPTTGVTFAELAALRLAVRVDRPGEALTDYHTVSGASHSPTDPDQQRLPTADGGRLPVEKSTKATRRQYRSDAAYTAYLDGNPHLLHRAAQALRRPRYPLYLGRRSCPPGKPVLIALDNEADLDHALRTTPWQATDRDLARHLARGHTHVTLETVTEDQTGPESLPDQPDPTAPPYRPRYIERRIRHGHITLPLAPDTTAHAPFELLG
ncbi:type I-E CRISPR-associated protein Cas5/CasD [Streptomyces sp. NPDC018019]|uniref:type I-E CRISPR-associated protein Cas5/CasD n=1 Tax=Streptomyces sp. NPDC018019 TaxID=3365030 RepID=UPI0037B6DC62